VPAARRPSVSVVVGPTIPSKPSIEVKQLEAKCKHCSSPRLSVFYGKHGYYFKCGACDQNTAIPMKCSCGQKAKVRKEREKFFLECGPCQRSVLFFINLTALV
jgi:hypothetical protein